MIKIKLSSFNSFLLKKTIILFKKYYFQNIFFYNKDNLLKVISLPKKSRYYCLLRSPHIDKCSREQFKITIYKSILIFTSLHLKDLSFINDIKIPSGVSLEIMKEKKK